MRSTVRAAVAACAVGLTGGLATLSTASDAHEAPARADGGQVAIVQAVPEASMDVAVDGEPVETGAEVGAVIGPLDLPAGSHEVTFSDGTQEITSTVEVTAGTTNDVVVHRPAEVDGTPVVSVYPTPPDPIAPGKARVLLAHTATVPPADVVVDGQTVFTNIANGEFATADVAAGGHQVSLLPAGVTGDPILGPLDVTLEEGTITAVYAVGTPANGSMDVIVRVSGGTPMDAGAPTGIDTGSAGLAGRVRVWTFAGR